MKCKKCNSTLEYIENDKMWRCKKCRTFVNPINPQHEELLINDIKKAPVISGYGLAIIAITLMFWITEGNIFFYPIFSLIFIIWSFFLPALGATLILMDKFKIGGIILATGSIILFPLGFIGVYYGIQSYNLANKLKQNEEFNVETKNYNND
ncbi:MAG: hypothetical protein KAS67_04385 [Thermoplasmata archaeon]|nr:hypothetical protein [Thermoplasmata archaeon]